MSADEQKTGSASPPPAAPSPAPEAPPPGRRLDLKRLALVLVLALALVAPAYFLGRHLILEHRKAEAGPEVVLEIPRGAGAVQVGRMLQRAGVVEHAWLFALASRLVEQPGRLQAGEYALSPAMRLREILEMLSQGRVLQHLVLIPEGFTLAQIVERLAEERLIDRQEAHALAQDPSFLASLGLPGQGLEGFLFPDTYQMPRGLTARAVLGAMAKRFQQAWEPLSPAARRLGLSRLQAVTLASIIEREAKLPAERPLVSAVYHNRLKRGMKLQADPTVAYGLPGLSGPLTRAHLEQDHPYNTYTREGLPPGPICSPGRASLAAAVNPAPVDYLYFVARGDGSHAFSVEYRDQINNVNRLRQQQRR
ncbi:MAG: endolytic transglycosylase MltG [Desulfarculus sp.]|nr:endolytic transglycosylase MltG [Desulfarculus sp.]